MDYRRLSSAANNNQITNNLKNKVMKTIIEKNNLNGSYLLYTSLNNGFAWYFSSYKAAYKAQKKLNELIKNKEMSEYMTYREVTKYILNN